MFAKLSSRKFKMGAYGAAVTAVVAVLLILINFAAVLLTQRADAFIDLTASKAFNVSEEIMEVFRSIKTPMAVTVLYDKEKYQTMNPYCAQVEYILDQAEKANDNITVRYVDPVENPEIGSSYPKLDCTQGDLIFENRNTGMANEVMFSDLFYISNNSITGSKAEAVIASKLLSMTSGKTFRVCITEGHEEFELESFTDLLKLNNYTVETVNLNTGEIPADALCLIIDGPSVDFSVEEIKKMEKFLENGGEFGKSIIYFSSMGNLDMPNLEGFLANYGLAVSDMIVAETNPNYIFGDKAAYAVSGYLEEEYSAKALNMGLLSISPYTRPIEMLFSSSSDVRTKGLMCFSQSALAVNPNDASQQVSGEEQTLYSAAVSEYFTYESGVGEKVSRIVAFGTVYFVHDTMLSTESLGNAEYMVGVMSKLAPNEISIEVASKSILGGYMSINAKQTKWLGIVFIGVVPAVIIALGVWVYVRRRNR